MQMQMGQGQNQGGGGIDPRLIAGGLGAAGGAGVALGLASYAQTAKSAQIGKWTGIASLGLSMLGGNQATPETNAAMEDANAVTAAANYVQNDIVLLRSAVQHLAKAQQAQNPLQFTSIQPSTPATANSSVSASTPTSNGPLLLLAGAALVIALAKD